MTEQPTPEQPPSEKPPIGRGIGCAYGGLAVIASMAIATVAIGFLVPVIPDSAGLVIVVVAVLIPIAAIVAAGIRWKAIPGFLLGIGLAIVLPTVIIGGCLAVLSASSGSQ